MEGRMKSFAQFLFLTLLLTTNQHAFADESDRQKIMGCLARGVNSYEGMLECAGFPVQPKLIESCRNGGSCIPPLRRAIDNLAPPGSPQALAIHCAQYSGKNDIAAFTACTRGQAIVTQEQGVMVDCAARASTAQPNRRKWSFGACAGPTLLGGKLSPEQQTALNCAFTAQGNMDTFASCEAQHFLGTQLTPEQQAAVGCARQSGGSFETFASCAAPRFWDRACRASNLRRLSALFNRVERVPPLRPAPPRSYST
jgi:hypothetical protein